MSNARYMNRTCPSLGLMDDAETSLAFPSIWNCCYRGRPIAPPKLKYQEQFCLCENHRECPLLSNEQLAPLPGHIRAPRSRVKKNQNTFLRSLLVFLIIVAVILVLAWMELSRGYTAPFGIEMAVAIPSAMFLPTTSDTPSPAATASLSPTLTHTAAIQTDTPAVLPSKHQLEVPIGTEYKFLIHRVLEGENLDQYAPKYETSVDAIVAVNHDLTPPVWVGTLVVIPLGFTDVSDLPGFETYMITEADLTVEMLAQKLNVDPLDLKYYNSISTGDLLLVGDWLLIPRKKVAP